MHHLDQRAVTWSLCAAANPASIKPARLEGIRTGQHRRHESCGTRPPMHHTDESRPADGTVVDPARLVIVDFAKPII